MPIENSANSLIRGAVYAVKSFEKCRKRTCSAHFRAVSCVMRKKSFRMSIINTDIDFLGIHAALLESIFLGRKFNIFSGSYPNALTRPSDLDLE